MAIAAQLDATGISLTPQKKNGKQAKKMKDAKSLAVAFTIVKNITAQNGMRTLYVRITTPTGTVLTQGGTFNFENRSLEYSMKKQIEYTGEETHVSTFWSVGEFLSGGEYRVDIFADGDNIGSRTFSFEK